jgi:predicted transcriptional regulator
MVVLCSFVKHDWQGDLFTMARPKGRQLPNRVSVALTDQQLTALESIAQESQAAVSWVVRRAVAEFLQRNCPQAAAADGRTTHAPCGRE